MGKHTPGPWTVKRGEGRYAYHYYVESHVYSTPTVVSGRDQIVQCRAGDPYPEEAEANASLIAAAPDMLAALKAAVAEIHNPGAGRYSGIDVAEMVYAAIAKAEGRLAITTTGERP